MLPSLEDLLFVTPIVFGYLLALFILVGFVTMFSRKWDEWYDRKMMSEHDMEIDAQLEGIEEALGPIYK